MANKRKQQPQETSKDDLPPPSQPSSNKKAKTEKAANKASSSSSSAPKSWIQTALQRVVRVCGAMDEYFTAKLLVTAPTEVAINPDILTGHFYTQNSPPPAECNMNQQDPLLFNMPPCVVQFDNKLCRPPPKTGRNLNRFSVALRFDPNYSRFIEKLEEEIIFDKVLSSLEKAGYKEAEHLTRDNVALSQNTSAVGASGPVTFMNIDLMTIGSGKAQTASIPVFELDQEESNNMTLKEAPVVKKDFDCMKHLRRNHVVLPVVRCSHYTYNRAKNILRVKWKVVQLLYVTSLNELQEHYDYLRDGRYNLTVHPIEPPTIDANDDEEDVEKVERSKKEMMQSSICSFI